MTFGAVLLSKTSLGVAPWEALNFGLSAMFGLTVGTWIIILSFLALILSSILERKIIKLSSFATSLIIGFFMDFWVYSLRFISIENIVIEYITFVISIIILSIGISIYLLPHLPANPIDYLMIVISNKIKLKIMHSKLIIDITLLFLAFCFHGPIGIGTIFLAITIGPAINWWQSLLSKYFSNPQN